MPYVIIAHMNYWKGRKQTAEHIAKRVAHYKGKPLSVEHRRKIGEAQKGEKGNNWKGMLATYNSVHSWVRDTFGKPSKCEHCNGNFSGRKIEWANLSGKYTRERNDWIRLCARCHRAFDKTNPIVSKRLISHQK